MFPYLSVLNDPFNVQWYSACVIIKCFEWFAYYAFSCSLCCLVGFVWLCDDLEVAMVLSAFAFLYIYVMIVFWLDSGGSVWLSLPFQLGWGWGLGICFPTIQSELRFDILSSACLCLAKCSARMCVLVLWYEWELYIKCAGNLSSSTIVCVHPS